MAEKQKNQDEFDLASNIQKEIDEQRLKPVNSSKKIIPVLTVALAVAALTYTWFYFENDLLPRAAERAAYISDLSQVVPVSQQEPRFNPQTDPLSEVNGIWVSPNSSKESWQSINNKAIGLLTFRGNPTRTYHGEGPFPDKPKVIWKNKISCSISSVNNESKQWCGTGWTGQPVIFKSPKDENNWIVAVGGYNKSINFYDYDSGKEVYEPYATNDIIKGTVTVDPDGYPLMYSGSRDNYFHIVALDREAPEALWKLSAESDQETFWNNDWDSSALVIDDYLFIGGENSRFYIIKLNRAYDKAGKVTVNPVEVFSAQSWDNELLSQLGDTELSIENSLAISGNTLYFSNSGGLVQGWDISNLKNGKKPQRTFRYWTGDDTDATIIIDKQGNLYIASEYQRENKRSDEIGQLIKLDPKKEDPLVWSKKVENGFETGIWATPAIYESQIIVPTSTGYLLGVDKETGEELWKIQIGNEIWSSPVVINDKLLQADCKGVIRLYKLKKDGTKPEIQWNFKPGESACIESTPAVWDGKIFVGARNGNFYAIS